MTRTRTQTALTKLAQKVAEVHGEMALVGRLLAQAQARDDALVVDALSARQAVLEGDREALYVTLRQFDSSLEPAQIGGTNKFLSRFGRGPAAVQRYCRHHVSQRAATTT